jgi:hypothetical protein
MEQDLHTLLEHLYFTLYMRIVRQIIDIVPKWFHVYIQDYGAH